MAGSRSRSSMRVPARLRLWPSSPICTIWATIALTSTGPVAARPPACQQRPEHGGHPAQPVDHLGRVGAVAQHLAQALVERAPGPRRRAPGPRARTPTSTARPRRPSGPPRARWWHGSSRHSPPASSRSASVRVAARPSKTIAPMSAPRSGPRRAGPVDRRPGVQELARLEPQRLPARAGRRPAAPGGEHPADGGRRSRRGGAGRRARAARASRRCPASGGRQSTRTTGDRLRGQRVGEQGDPGGDHVGSPSGGGSPPRSIVSPASLTSSASDSTACAPRPRWTGAPMHRLRCRASAWRSRPCGSPLVPHSETTTATSPAATAAATRARAPRRDPGGRRGPSTTSSSTTARLAAAGRPVHSGRSAVGRSSGAGAPG